MEKLTCTVNEACAALSLGRSKFYQLVKSGEVNTFKVGTRTLVTMASLLQFLDKPAKGANRGRDRKYSPGAQAYFEEKFKEQGGICAIDGCSRPAVHLDHNHDFEKKDFRGWRAILCSQCNTSLGYIENARKPQLLEYLEIWRSRNTKKHKPTRRAMSTNRSTQII